MTVLAHMAAVCLSEDMVTDPRSVGGVSGSSLQLSGLRYGRSGGLVKNSHNCPDSRCGPSLLVKRGLTAIIKMQERE
jgi:hypothetical protein